MSSKLCSSYDEYDNEIYYTSISYNEDGAITFTYEAFRDYVYDEYGNILSVKFHDKDSEYTTIYYYSRKPGAGSAERKANLLHISVGSDGRLVFRYVTSGTQVEIFTGSGVCIGKTIVTGYHSGFRLPKRGVYVILVKSENKVVPVKVMY